MLSHKNVIVVLYILFTLLYSITSVKRKDSGRKQSKTALNINRAANLSDGAAKAFLTNLYKNYFNETGQVKRTNTAIPEIIHSVQGTACVKNNVIRFNMKGINAKEYVQKAEIRVKVEYSNDQDHNASHPVKLGLYDKITGVLISQAVLRETHPTWKIFRVRSAVVRWLRSPHSIHGVRVEVLAESETQKPAPKVFMHGGKSGPFLVVYTDGRLLHGVEDSPFIRDRFRRDSKTNTNRTAAIPSPSPAVLCSRRDLHVNAKHIFGNLIIAPLSFNAFDCAGECDATFAPESFSNHAIVRVTAAQHWERGSHATAPCCVPTNYSSLLGVLYTKQDGHVVLRQYKGMAATECGCR